MRGYYYNFEYKALLSEQSSFNSNIKINCPVPSMLRDPGIPLIHRLKVTNFEYGSLGEISAYGSQLFNA